MTILEKTLWYGICAMTAFGYAILAHDLAIAAL